MENSDDKTVYVRFEVVISDDKYRYSQPGGKAEVSFEVPVEMLVHIEAASIFKAAYLTAVEKFKAPKSDE